MAPRIRCDEISARRLAIVVFLFTISLEPLRFSERVHAEETGFTKQIYTYKAVGQCKIQADVYRVSDSMVRPVIVYIHGGALIMESRGGINSSELERYINAGYGIVSIDYWLAPETKLKEIIEDIRDAYNWIRTEGPRLFRIDPNRIAVIGGSAGGYLTLMGGFCLQPRPRALVSFYGYGDIAGPWVNRPNPFYRQQPLVSKEEAGRAVGTEVISSEAPSGSERGRFYLYCRQQGLWPKEVTGHDPDKESEAFNDFCPIRNVTRDYPPTMLLHGDKDTDVPFEQSVQMAKELDRRSVPHIHGKGLDDPQRYPRHSIACWASWANMSESSCDVSAKCQGSAMSSFNER